MNQRLHYLCFLFALALLFSSNVKAQINPIDTHLTPEDEIEVTALCIESTSPTSLRKLNIKNVGNSQNIWSVSFGDVSGLVLTLAPDESYVLEATVTDTENTIQVQLGRRVIFTQSYVQPFICTPTVDNLPLSVYDTCNPTPSNNKLVWAVNNPNSVPVRVRYMAETKEGALTKSITVEAESTATFSFNKKFGTGLVFTTSNGFFGCQTHTNQVCSIDGITVTNVCTDHRKRRRWRIENPNSFSFKATITYAGGNAKTVTIPAAGKGQDINGVANSGNYRFFDTPNTVENITVSYGKDQTLVATFFTGLCNDNNLDTLSCETGKRSYLLSNAVSDSYHGGNHNHSIWLSGFNGGGAAKMTFDSDAYLVYDVTGKSAYIHGTATMTTGNLAGSKWIIYAPFGEKNANTVPKKELRGNAYDPNDGGVNVDDWFYFLLEDGAFMRQTDGDGYITMSTMPADGRYGLQIGKGANGKNINFGASSWFFYTYNGQTPKQGDFNLDLDAQCENLSSCSIFYIDNTTDYIYLVDPFNGNSSNNGRNSQQYSEVSLTPVVASPYHDAHIALNIEGDKLYVFESRGPEHRYGYFDLSSEIFRPLGTLYIEGGLVQASFSPYGKLYLSSTSSNEILVLDEPDNPASLANYGTIKMADGGKTLNIAGADIAFDQDGSFYLATHAHGGAIFTVSGLANNLVARRLGTANTIGKVTGLALMEDGNGSLIYSARDAEGMYMVHQDDPNNHIFLPFDDTFTKSGWGDMTTACMEPLTECDGCYASEVIAFNQGTTRNGGAIASERSNPNNALGQPQENDTYNFVSLGFGGSIELALPCPVYNHNKNGVPVGNSNSIDNVNGDGYSKADFIIVETSFGKANANCGVDQSNNYPERVLVYGRESLTDDWVLLTQTPVCRTSFIDIGPAVESGALSYVKYVKLVDQTDPNRHGGGADGYDVDGIIFCPDLVIGAITGEGRSALVDARKGGDDKNLYQFNFEHQNTLKDGDLSGSLEINTYPNPTNSLVSIDVNSTTHENISLSIFDNTGSLIFEKEDFDEIHTSFDFSKFAKGMYIIRVQNGTEQKVKKILVK